METAHPKLPTPPDAPPLPSDPTAAPAPADPIPYAQRADNPWPAIARFLAVFGLVLSCTTLVRMAIDAAGAFAIVDAPSLLASQAAHPLGAVWVILFLIVNTVLHAVLLFGSLQLLLLRPRSVDTLRTYALASLPFVAVTVTVNCLWFAFLFPTRGGFGTVWYFLAITTANGLNAAAFPAVVFILLRTRAFAGSFDNKRSHEG